MPKTKRTPNRKPASVTPRRPRQAETKEVQRLKNDIQEALRAGRDLRRDIALRMAQQTRSTRRPAFYTSP